MLLLITRGRRAAGMAFPLLALMLALLAAPAAAQDDEAGFVPLFNGQDLTGWDGNPEFWSVQEGAITGQTTSEKPTDGNTFITWTDGPLDDFELRLQYRIVGGNSGIQYRSQSHGNWVVGGYQADFESGDTYSGILYEERGRGILAQRGQVTVIDADGQVRPVANVGDTTEIQSLIKKEDWNDYKIIARGNHLTHVINGRVTVDVTDNQLDRRSMSGILALQLHAGPPMTVQFQNIRLKRLPLDGRKKIVLVAGRPSHAAGDHEFNAGSALIKKCLDKLPGVQTALYLNGWPSDPTAFDNADAIMLYMDGGGGHPAIQPDRLAKLQELMDRGVGLACLHYAVEVPADRGGPEFLNWIGGYYETGFSINPHWTADFQGLSSHPVLAGVQPFAINDEWYYNIRFRPGAVEPILVATPPDDTRRTAAAAENPGRAEIVAWTTERADGGRGFGFTGGHVHKNWGQDDYRRLVLNALLWVARADVPAGGVVSSISEEDLGQNLDPK
jgi:type 1 glutamine amidotransferase